MWTLANAVAVTAVAIKLAVAAVNFCHVVCQHVVACDLCLEDLFGRLGFEDRLWAAIITLKEAA